MTLGAFAVLIAASRKDKRIESFDDIQGLAKTRPALALTLTVFLFSLTGLPPTAGFLGKLNLFFAAWAQGNPSNRWLAVVLAINAALGAWFYLKMIGLMYLRDPIDRSEQEPSAEAPSLVAAGLCLMGTIGFFFVPGWLWIPIQGIMP
jgi:NADH-quinone oxidoreductase subunit N